MNHTLRFSRFSLSSAIAAALLSSISGSALAQDNANTLDRVQVTGSRIALSADQSVHAVTVLTRADIEASHAIDLIDILGKQPGIDIVRSGGSGSQNSIFVRGGNSNHALVLIDGIRVNSATQGLFDFAHLPLALIERIEIARGPRAAVWGSDALSGVIHIFTRAPKGTHAELRAGSYGRFGADFGFGVGDGDSRFGLTAGYDELDGFSATNPSAWGHDPDNDGYRNAHLALQGQTRLGSQKLSFSAMATRGDIEFDQGQTQADNRSGQISLKGALAADWQHALTLGQATEKLDTPDYFSVYGSTRRSLDWTLNRSENSSRLALGVNLVDENGYSRGYDGPEFNQDRDNLGVFAVWNKSFNKQQLELATRWDDNSQFGSRFTSSAGWAMPLGDNSRLRASWGQGFRAPNFNELYYPGFFGFYAGNPDLSPERSRTAELGFVSQINAQLDLELSAYRSDVRDLIAFQGLNNQAINIDQARIEGAEATLNARYGAWNWRAQGTWTHAVNANTGAALLRRPKLKGSLDVRYQFDNQADIGLSLGAAGERPDFGGALPGYGRIDLSAAWPINAQWRLEGRLENLTDRDYQLVNGYNTPGRSVMFRLNYNGQ
jgi:vitamin B12 transporter